MADNTILKGVKPPTTKKTRVWVSDKVFNEQRAAANKSRKKSLKAYRARIGIEKENAWDNFLTSYRGLREKQGLPWYDATAWHEGRDQAMKASAIQWKRKSDQELLEALHNCLYGTGAVKVDPCFYQVVKAELDMVKDSAMLYASVSTIAKEAHVCRSTVIRVNRELEEMGVIRRQQSGGCRMDEGKLSYRTNIYFFCHQRLREVLGVKCRYRSRFVIPQNDRRNSIASLSLRATIQSTTLFGRTRTGHPFYSRSGYARNLGAPRQKRYRDLIKIYVCAGPGREWTVYNAKTYKLLKPISTYTETVWKTPPQQPEYTLTDNDISTMETLPATLQCKLARIGASKAHLVLQEYDNQTNALAAMEERISLLLKPQK